MAAPPILTSTSMEPLLVLPPDAIPKVDHLVTEDDTPVDSIYVERQERLLINPLYDSWVGPGDKRTFIALANVGMFYSLDEPPIVPDGLLSFDVRMPPHLREKRYRSYFIWEFGKAPDVVVEMVSNLEGEELGKKLRIYATIGIPYYVVWDPLQLLGLERLRTFQLEIRSYKEVEKAWFPQFKLGLKIWEGRFCDAEEPWLRWVDGAGQLIPTGAERADQEQSRADHESKRADEQKFRADQERARAEEQQARAEQERKRAEEQQARAEQERKRAEEQQARADQERNRAEKLAAQLRAMGIDVPE